MSDDFVIFECVFLEIYIYVLKYKFFIIIKCEFNEYFYINDIELKWYYKFIICIKLLLYFVKIL